MFYCLFYGFIIVIVIDTNLDIDSPMNKESKLKATKQIPSLEMVEFIYDNAVGFLEGTRISMKSISDRGLYLLSYLLIVLGYFIITLFTNFRPNHFNYLSNISLWIIVYYSYLSYYLVSHIKPRYAYSLFVAPKILLTKERAELTVHQAKITRIVEIEINSQNNIEMVDKMKLCLDKVIDLAFIIPYILFRLWKFPKKLFLFCRNNLNFFIRFR